MSDDSTFKTIKVALGVCLVCSVLVSTAAVALHDIQERNKKLDKIKNILIAGNVYDKTADVESVYKETISPKMVDISTGEFLSEDKFNDELNYEEFDIKKLSASKKYGMELSAGDDIARIKRIPKYMQIYFVKQEDKISKIILPIYGKGLWSTLYGFLALDKDLKTIKGITFYEHGETPGLGGEVDNPKWKAIWNGKKAFGKNGEVKISVIKGMVDNSSDNSIYQVDGLSGSTITTRGVDKLVKFWLDESGYRKLITKLGEEGLNE